MLYRVPLIGLHGGQPVVGPLCRAVVFSFSRCSKHFITTLATAMAGLTFLGTGMMLGLNWISSSSEDFGVDTIWSGCFLGDMFESLPILRILLMNLAYLLPCVGVHRGSGISACDSLYRVVFY